MSDVTAPTAEYVIRYDACELLGAPVKRLDGSVIYQAVLARPGAQLYLNADGTKRIEYRSVETLRRAVEARKYDLVPATIAHNGGWLSAHNVSRYSVGTVGQDVHMKGDLVVGSIVVHTAAGVKAVSAEGYNQISPGYKARMVRAPNGMAPDGTRCDYIQEEIVEVNHSAFVKDARGGPIASVRLDSTDAVQIVKGKPMDLEQLQEELTKQRVKVATLAGDLEVTKVQLATANTRYDEADKALKASEKKNQELQARFDSVSEQVRLDSSNIANQVQLRVRLETEAAAILPPTTLPGVRLDSSSSRVSRFSGHSNQAIMKAVVEHVTKTKQDDNVNEHYLQARYDAAVETAEKTKGSFAGLAVNMDAAHAPNNRLAAAATAFAAAAAEASNTFIAPRK